MQLGMSENIVLIWQYGITICIISREARFARPLLYPIVLSFVRSAYLHT